jgi:dihydrodipicolinate synthase/N-acetylneuraminate lyase
MLQSIPTWRGYFPAAPTPFNADGGISETAWHRLLDLYLADGVHGLLINGTAGEWTSQSAEERSTNIEIVASFVGDRIPVIAGCTAFTGREVIALANAASQAGATAALCTPPPYLRPELSDLVEFYRIIAANSEIPVMVYNWPRGTGIDIPVGVAEEIFSFDNIAGFKNSTTDIGNVIEYLRVFGNNAVVFASVINRPGLALMREFGCSGYIDGGGLGARWAVPFFDAYWSGDFETARLHADRYADLMQRLVAPDFGGVYGSAQAQLKAAMALLGQPGGTVREPLQPLTDPAQVGRLASVLEQAGFTVTD